MEYSLPVTLGILLALMFIGFAGLVLGNMMTPDSTLIMANPSMLIFGLIAFGLDVKHGEFRTHQ